MEIAVKAALLGCISAAGALLIKKSNPEIALLLAAAVVLCVSGAAIKLFSSVAGLVIDAENISGMPSAVFTPVIKCVAIGILAKIAAELCRDASQGAVAAAVETVGAAAGIFTALPLFKSLITMIGGMI